MIIETENLRLRPLTMEDASWVREYLSDPKIAAALPAVSHPLQEGDVESWLRGAVEDISFAIERPADGAVGGVVGLHLEEGNRGQIGGWCGEPYRLNGYAVEASRAVIRYGYEVLGLTTIYAIRNGRLWVAPRDGEERHLPFRNDPDGWDALDKLAHDPRRPGFFGRVADAVSRRRRA